MVMLLSPSWRFRPRLVLLSAAVFALTICALWTRSVRQSSPKKVYDAEALRRDFPLTWEHVHMFNGTGGAWYIPPQWLDKAQKEPKSIVEAARLASEVAMADHRRQLAFSNIPLLIHQTAKNTQITTWNVDILPLVEKWLQDVTSRQRGSPMAYFFWDDEGIDVFMKEYEKDILEDFMAMFTPVERADIFRILACKYFGGVYADVDTEPLLHPSDWVRSSDLVAWTDEVTGTKYGLESIRTGKDDPQPVNLIWGLEADTDPDSDSYWRMGYTYPVQLTQWALASAPKHPVLSQFMEDLKGRIDEEKASMNPPKADPLTRTGPAAVTLATSTWLEKEFKFRWNSLTGLKDGGKSKLVSDVLVLPITGFSPGRGKYGNMGSKPATHPDARLVHHAFGSWRKFDLQVELGKFCRTVFGLCRDWSKVPS